MIVEEKVLNQCLQVISSFLEVEIDKVSPDVTLSSLGITSLEVFEIALELEEDLEFFYEEEVELNYEEVESILERTVREVAHIFWEKID